MLQNNSNDIRCIRGSTLRMALNVLQPDGTPYQLQEGEVIRFGVKASPHDSSCRIEKVLTEDDCVGDSYILTLQPSDTLGLPFGKYCYDAGIQSGQDYYPILPVSRFFLTENITSIEVDDEP